MYARDGRSPVVGYESSATRRDRVGVIVAGFPDDIAVRLNINVLILNRSTSGQRNIEEPVRIVGIEHGSNGGLKRGAPTTEFRDTARDEDVVTGVRRLCI